MPSLPLSRSSTISLPSSPASTLLMVNPNCPVHNNTSSQEANNDDMFEDDDDEDDEDFFQQRLHPLQMIFIGIIDKIVNLTSHTYFAKLLQVVELPSTFQCCICYQRNDPKQSSIIFRHLSSSTCVVFVINPIIIFRHLSPSTFLCCICNHPNNPKQPSLDIWALLGHNSGNQPDGCKLQATEIDFIANKNRPKKNFYRIVFPVAFALVNAIYWPTYMYLLWSNIWTMLKWWNIDIVFWRQKRQRSNASMRYQLANLHVFAMKQTFKLCLIGWMFCIDNKNMMLK